MNPTSVSLLGRLRHRPTQADWARFHDLYEPLIRRWLARVPGLADEAADLTQEVLVTVFRELAAFERRREGSFRAWLRTITANRVRSAWRARRRRPAVGLPGRSGGGRVGHDRGRRLPCQVPRPQAVAGGGGRADRLRTGPGRHPTGG